MSYDQVLNLSLSQFNACLRLAQSKIACDYPENYKVFMSKLPDDVRRTQKKQKDVIQRYKKDEAMKTQKGAPKK